jgi:hypothetical protein
MTETCLKQGVIGAIITKEGGKILIGTCLKRPSNLSQFQKI